jgi:hypothetical protein
MNQVKINQGEKSYSQELREIAKEHVLSYLQRKAKLQRG